MFKVTLAAVRRAAVKEVVPASVMLEEVALRTSSPLRVTLLKVPPLVVVRRVVPSAKLIVPPTIVPPAMFHEPVVEFNWIVFPVLVIVPAILTVPAAVVMVPIPAAAFRVPSNWNVPPVASRVPAFVQLVLFTRMVPAVTRRVPLLVSVELFTSRVCPVASAEINPLLTSVAAELLFRLNPPPEPAASRTTADAPKVTVPAPPTAMVMLRFPTVAPSATTREFNV